MLMIQFFKNLFNLNKLVNKVNELETKLNEITLNK